MPAFTSPSALAWSGTWYTNMSFCGPSGSKNDWTVSAAGDELMTVSMAVESSRPVPSWIYGCVGVGGNGSVGAWRAYVAAAAGLLARCERKR